MTRDLGPSQNKLEIYVPAATRVTYRGWVINALKALGHATPRAVYDWIERNEVVPAIDLSERTKDGKDTVFEKTVRFARWELSRDGIVTSPKRGVWALK